MKATEKKFVDFPLRLALRRVRGYFVYILWLKDEAVYIGSTSGIVARIQSHKSKMKFDPDYIFDSVTVKRFGTIKEVRKEEARLIRLLNPEHNTVHRNPLSYSNIDLLAALGLAQPAERIEGLRRL